MNRPTEERAKIDDPAKHTYPAFPEGADDEESTKRNLELLKGESLKPKPCSDAYISSSKGYHLEFKFYRCGRSQRKSIS